MSEVSEFGLLGPLLVRNRGAEVQIRRGHQRALLALLLLQANEAVPIEEITGVLWGAAPPVSAPVAVRSYVQGLRLALGEAGRQRISTQPRGYLIRVADGELDVARFERLLASARAAARDGSWLEAAGRAREALSWWRGEPLADIESEAMALREVPRLAELRLQAVEIRIDADLRLGGHAEAIAELPRLCAAHPLREQLHGLLMRALYQCGRQAEALQAYQHARDMLVTELGVEPGPGLQELHQRMLTADPALMPPEAQPARAAIVQAAVPRELPAPVRHFTGRDDEQAALTRMLGRPGAPGTEVIVISAISGTAGVGKTALAVHWAHQVADRFGDGQLYVNLRGFDPSGVPVTPAEAVRGFLDALGVPPERSPRTTDAQAGLYRSLMAGKRMLVVLDNARDEAQVRPLLPSSPESVVIITSRNQLAGLAAADGAQLLTLDLLPHDEAVQLLTARIGSARAAAQPAAADEIAWLCARLPLALAVAAAQTAARPRVPLADLAAELRDAADRLDALDAGDPAASVAAVFSWSCQQLEPAAARLFRLLGLHPGPDISIPAAASLAETDQPEARRLLRALARDCLITEHVPGRYAFHDLLRAYAASQARACDSQPDRDAATGRVLDHYLHTASHSSELLQPSRNPLALTPARPGTRPEQPADHRHALAWFEAEHQVLLAAITLAAKTGADSHAWQLPCAMTEYLFRRGHRHEQVTIMGAALTAATRLDDTLGQAMSLRYLGRACADAGDHDQARAHLEQGLRLYQRLGDRLGQAWIQNNLAALFAEQGRYADSLGHGEQALRLFQASGDEAEGKYTTLCNAAWCRALLGDYQWAQELCEQLLSQFHDAGLRHVESAVWDTLGYIEHHLGNFAKAAADFERSLALVRDEGDRRLEAATLTHVGDARHAGGDLPQARDAWRQALAIYDEIQHPRAGEVRAKLASTHG
jgi:DNA-binding SARP family transcriptional activator